MAKRAKGEFVINRKKWLTGEALRDGATYDSALLDEQTGLMCCLGQACKQLGLNKDLLLAPSPDDVLRLTWNEQQTELVKKKLQTAGLVRVTAGLLSNTNTVEALMEANDDEDSTREQRESAVTRLFKKIGWSVRFSGKYPDYNAIGAKR